MRYVNTVERFAIKEGIEIGRNEGVQIGRNEGMQIGRNEGVQIGLLTGQSNMLVTQLQHRFGDLPDEITNKVKNATLEQIQAWSIKLIDAKTLPEVFK